MTSTIRRTWPQWLAGLAVTFLVIEVGLIGGWTSPYMSKLLSEDGPYYLTLAESSWVASLVNFSRLFGAILGAIGCQTIGSKTTNMLTVVPAIVCWILTLIANSAMSLYAARLSGGLVMGMTFSCFPLYLGEISDPEIRGAVVSMAIAGAPIGNTIVGFIGAEFSITESSIIFLVASAILLIFFMCLPESPHHLINKSYTQKAKDSIAWYHRDCDVDSEYTVLEKFVLSSKAITLREKLNEFRRPEIRRATFIILALYFFMHMSGLNNIVFYMATILTHAKVTIITPSMCATIVMSFGIVSAIASVTFMDKLGRRTLFMSSSLTVALSLIVLEVHFTLLDAGYESTSLEWLPITSLIIGEIAIFFGLSPVPSTVLSELFPPNIKCTASLIANVGSAFFAFLCTKTYQPLLDVLGEEYVYWIYIFIQIFSIPFVIFLMPETKGKSLQQIQEDISPKDSTDKLSNS